MLNPPALANAFAGVATIFYITASVLKAFSPPLFILVFNSQFLGANIASQVPKTNIANFLGLLIVIIALSWITGYLIAAIYNYSLKK
jgi:hypothetical protein